MTERWPFWAGGLALAGVMLLHWLTVHRMMSVSSRFSAVVDRVRWGRAEPVEALSPEELREALLAATQAEAGVGVPAPPASLPVPQEGIRPPQPVSTHLLFLGGLGVGGLLGATLSGTFSVTTLLRSSELEALAGGSGPGQAALLVGGGALVGFGTRMAGGCTSGHGLCGVSRLQPGSLLATAAFFGVGVAVSFALAGLT